MVAVDPPCTLWTRVHPVVHWRGRGTRQGDLILRLTQLPQAPPLSDGHSEAGIVGVVPRTLLPLAPPPTPTTRTAFLVLVAVLLVPAGGASWAVSDIYLHLTGAPPIN